MSDDVLVVGGGVVGVSVAYYLARASARVTLLEGGELACGSSFANAGLLVPSYSTPIATPETLSHGLKALFNPRGSFAIRPRLDPALLRWLQRFVCACRARRVAATIPILSRLSTASMHLYEELIGPNADQFGYRRRGWLYLYRTDRGLAEGVHQAGLVRSAGVPSAALDATTVRELEPSVRADLAGAVYYPDDAQVDPYRAVHALARLAEDLGVSFRTRVRVAGFRKQHGRVDALVTDVGEMRADRYVIAAGARSAPLVRRLGLDLPVQPAKGYSLTSDASDRAPTRPLMLGEAHVVVTPLGRRIRMTGGLELFGFDRSLSSPRLEAMRRSSPEYLADPGGLGSGEVWAGYRPLTPDGLPVIGPLERFSNVVLATGHGTLGVTLGPVTGQLLADSLTGVRPSADLAPLLPSRFGL